MSHTHTHTGGGLRKPNSDAGNAGVRGSEVAGLDESPETASQSPRTHSIENTFSPRTTNNGSGLFGSGVSGYEEKKF
jgi:hypothetical protein